jgi:hypothetical protein
MSKETRISTLKIAFVVGFINGMSRQIVFDSPLHLAYNMLDA